MGRATQGVKLINLKGEDSIASVARVEIEDEEEIVENPSVEQGDVHPDAEQTSENPTSEQNDENPQNTETE